MITRYICLLSIGLLTSGCSGATGTALAALGASAVTAGGAYGLSAIQEDTAEAAEWRASQKSLVAQITGAMLTRARALETENWDAAMELYMKVLDFNEKQQPQILIERLRDRIKRAKEET